MKGLRIENYRNILNSARLEDSDFETVDCYLDYVKKWEKDLRMAVENPKIDFFNLRPPSLPKTEIGKYVASCGFNVPLINSLSGWQKAIDDDLAMIRSELPQDYSGFTGVGDSQVIKRNHFIGRSLGNNQPTDYYQQKQELQFKHLRQGTLSVRDYMLFERDVNSWAFEDNIFSRQAQHLGIEYQSTDLTKAQASRWRYVPGSNIKIFADPNVEGRFHIGLNPSRQLDSLPTVGFYIIEPDQHLTPQRFVNHESEFIAKPCIDLYNKIKNLPLFDQTQMPVLELQAGDDGHLYFLQYYKTNQKINYVDEFQLPTNKQAFISNNVRGTTTGSNYRLFFGQRINQAMANQAIFYNPNNDCHQPTLQFISKIVDFVWHSEYIVFKDDHFADVGVYQPKIAVGTEGNYWTNDGQSLTDDNLLKRIKNLANRYCNYRDNLDYINIRLTANGRQAVIESDWQIKKLST